MVSGEGSGEGEVRVITRMAPPPAQAYGGAMVPEAKETWKPVYEGVLERTIRTRSPAAAPEASAKAPSAAALMKPG